MGCLGKVYAVLNAECSLKNLDFDGSTSIPGINADTWSTVFGHDPER
jgi:hypothetical protein